MTTGKALNGKPYAGNPHVRFDEGEVASAATPRRGSLLYKRKVLVVFGALCLSVLAALAAQTVQHFYCKYCGYKSSSVRSLTASLCQRHPNGPGAGRHALYEGGEKSSYTCKYCGLKSSAINSLTSSKCQRHPNGPMKGRHEPAL